MAISNKQKTWILPKDSTGLRRRDLEAALPEHTTRACLERYTHPTQRHACFQTPQARPCALTCVPTRCLCPVMVRVRLSLLTSQICSRHTVQSSHPTQAQHVSQQASCNQPANMHIGQLMLSQPCCHTRPCRQHGTAAHGLTCGLPTWPWEMIR